MLKRGACQIMRPGDLSQDPFSVRSSEVAQGDRPVLLHVPCPEIPIAVIGADAIVQLCERQVRGRILRSWKAENRTRTRRSVCRAGDVTSRRSPLDPLRAAALGRAVQGLHL